ncbi:uncharacterized protein LOC131857329 [Cryptomeria japonica]|uniref:uncharacterized protein LOC131857329 n=1 Tax=Cryptomeria japonica TaxID=3369 RepID=UPI0027DA460F|nr:uncharacterized protein LOC131857329 [Cryptomeria japonica]
MKIIKRVLDAKKKALDSKLRISLWANRLTVKRATGKTPFELVYRTDVGLPVKNLLPIYKFIQDHDNDILDPMQERIMQVTKLEKKRRDGHKKNLKKQQQVKYLFNTRTSQRTFQPGDMVLSWNARDRDKGKHGKFEAL